MLKSKQQFGLQNMCIKLYEMHKSTGPSPLVVCYRCFLQLIENCCVTTSCLSVFSSEDNHSELPESYHWPFPGQNMLHLQGGQGPGLPVLCCWCLGPGSGLPVGNITHSLIKPAGCV